MAFFFKIENFLFCKIHKSSQMYFFYKLILFSRSLHWYQVNLQIIEKVNQNLAPFW